MGVGGAPGMPLSMYSAPYSAETMAAYFPALGGGDQFYPNPVSTLNDLQQQRVHIYMCQTSFQHFYDNSICDIKEHSAELFRSQLFFVQTAAKIYFHKVTWIVIL
jgi:hypothetical protein